MGPPPEGRDPSEEDPQGSAVVRTLRRHERARRSTVARRLLPDLAADAGLPMDIFGDVLVSSDSDPDAPPPSGAALRADERQSRCLRLARSIYLHAAKIRVLYRRYLDRSLPSVTPPRSGPAPAANPVPEPGQAESTTDDDDAQSQRPRGPACRGPLCGPLRACVVADQLTG